MYRRLPIEFDAPAILIEMAPTSFRTQFAKMQRARRAALNVMRHLGMIEGEPELPARQVVFHRLSEQHELTAGVMGFACFYKGEVDAVDEGELICEVRSLKDFSVLERHEAPCAGGLASVGPVESHIVLPGEQLATLQPGAEIIHNH
jgi:predicted deacylase